MEKKKLRVGILLNNFEIPAWAFAMLEEISGSEYAEICLVVTAAKNEATSTPEKPSVPSFGKIGKYFRIASANRATLLYLLFTKFENRKFRMDPDAFADVDATPLFKNVPVKETVTIKKGSTDRFKPEDIEAVKKHDLDVLIRLGFGILKGDILNAAKYGVWSFHHGDNEVNRGGPAGVWEVFEKHAVTGSILQILNEELDGGTVLYRSWSPTDPLSVNRNRNRYFWRTLNALPAKLKELHTLGADEFFARTAHLNSRIPFYSNRLYVTPSNREVFSHIIRYPLNHVRHKIIDMFYDDHWFLMFDIRDGVSTAFWRFKKIMPPRDRFWADPHIIYRDGKYFIFIEEYMYSTGKGHISVITMDENGNYGPPKIILDEKHHLSYPFVFKWNEEYYMIPESAGTKSVECYRCESFPDRWVHHKTLMKDISAVDATLLEHDGKWWVFTAVSRTLGASASEELCIFHADNPLSGDWTPHPENPVVCDARKARPAGALFLHNGKLFRPGQNASGGYGSSISINHVTCLSETHYSEEPAGDIKPLWDKKLKGVHTFNHEGRLTVIDGKYGMYTTKKVR